MLLILFFGGLLSRAVPAEMLHFAAHVQGETHEAAVETVDAEGIAYVSLSALTQQLGGSCEIAPASVRVDLAGRAARVNINDTRVEASLKRFTLRYPFIQQDGNALIALTDVPLFFKYGFDVDVSQQQAAPPAVRGLQVPTEPEPNPLGAAEEMLSLPDTPGAPPLTARSIILDPGHGGADTGCRGRALAEKDLTLLLAKRVQKLAEGLPGLTVLLTRDSDTDKSLESRVNYAKLRRADIFISLHAGAGLSQAGHGFEVFCQQRASISGSKNVDNASASLRLGSALAEGLAQATSATNRGIRRVNCRILKDLPMPGVLLEVGCLTNPSEEELLQTDDYQTRIAQGILARIQTPAPTDSAAGVTP